jgi:hypothetical protein
MLRLIEYTAYTLRYHLDTHLKTLLINGFTHPQLNPKIPKLEGMFP